MVETSELAQEQIDKSVDEWGGCPVCHKYDHYVNIGKAHWFVCHKHRKKWCIGWNLFSSWQYEPEERWRENAERIDDYEKVEPWYPWSEDKRSESGKGQTVRLFWLWDDLGAAPDSEDGLVWRSSKGEDYARSGSPIVVKARPAVSKYELACRLHRLADMVGAGRFQHRLLADSDSVGNSGHGRRGPQAVTEACQSDSYDTR